MNSNRTIRRLVLGLVAIGLLALIGAGPAVAKKPATEETSSTCPASSAGFREASNVAAEFSNSGNTTTYTFTSLAKEAGAGLIRYCVYPEPNTIKEGVTLAPQAVGANGEPWLGAKTKRSVAFVRPDGTASNIPLDGAGKPITMGTATWGELPAGQTILLHIADESVCGQGVPTCFVRPTGKSGPNCNAGPTNVAYSAIPTEVLQRCPPRYALGFEATSTKEAGDAVKLAGEGKYVHSLTVAFASFACTEGAWNTGNCVTAPAGKTYEHPIAARIYKVEGAPGKETLGAQIGEAEVNATIPYRPSKDETRCTGANAGKYFDEAAERCKSAIDFLVTFTFKPTAVPVPEDGRVIWTVSVNTTTTGYKPIGTPCIIEGCPYDALNLDTWSYAGEFGTFFPGEASPSESPYSGEDLNTEAWWTAGTSTGLTPKPEEDGQIPEEWEKSGKSGEAHVGELRPVGEIITE